LVSDDDGVLPSSPTQERKHLETSRSMQHQNKLQQRQKEQKKPKQKKRHGARNQHRHKIFVKWLLENFDLEQSRSTPPSVTAVTIPSSSSDGKIGDADSRKSNDNNSGVENREKTDSHASDNNMTVASCDTEKDDRSCTTAINSQNQKSHILDVAGGKGEVSARLTMCHQQRVVMVDPRPADVVDCFESTVLPKIPNKWQRRLEDQRETNPDFVRDIVESRFRQLVTTFDHHKIMTDFDEETERSSSPNTSGSRPDLTELQVAVQDATLIVGLHADGATEAIVDAALKYRKPFVVVPCCVFPNFFPMRRLLEDRKDGNPPQMIPVRTHEQFCTFLLRKDPRFVMEELPFEGRNIAIWWNGK
jgi:hypothetical protein